MLTLEMLWWRGSSEAAPASGQRSVPLAQAASVCAYKTKGCLSLEKEQQGTALMGIAVDYLKCKMF